MITDVTDPGAAQGSPARANPYVGPRSFRYGETIYGRSREIHELRDALIAERIVLLYSPSGAGKTSLLEAGLRPELESRDFVVLPTIRVSHEPPPSLDGVIVNRYVLSTVLSLEEGRPAGQRLSDAELVSVELPTYLERYCAELTPGFDPCLFFDQFEELFTLDPTDIEQKTEFLRILGITLRDRGRWALLSMREDFIAQLDPYLALIPKRLGYRYRLDLLGAEAAQASARRPAQEAGVDFTPDAAARLVDDLRRVRVQRGTTVSEELGPYVEPVQLQVVCRQLWTTLPADATSIEAGDVAAVGNVDDALAEFYVSQVRAVAATTGVSERALRAWFDERLITEQGFRTQVHEGPGDGAGPEVLRELEDAHLIRADRRRGTDWYELAHDRLVAPIRASNEAWRGANLSPLQLEAQLWEQNDRKGHLMTGEVLVAAEAWAANHQHELMAVDRDYLDACRAEHVRAERERKASRRNKVLALVASVVGVLALVVGALALLQSREAKRQEDRARQSEAAARQAEADAIAAKEEQERLGASAAWSAAGERSTDRDTKVLAPLYAFQTAGDDPSGLTRDLMTSRHYLRHDPVSASTAAVLSYDGALLVRGTDRGLVELVDVVSQERRPLATVGGVVTAVEASRVDDRVVVVSQEPAIRVWDLAAPGDPIELAANPDGTTVDGFAFGGSLIVARLRDGGGLPTGIIVWDGATGERLPAADLDVVPAERVALSADGTKLAAVDDERALRLWERAGESWRELPSLRFIAGFGSPLAFHPNGDELAAFGGDRTVHVVSVSQGTSANLEGAEQTGAVDLLFLPNGRLLGLSVEGRIESWSAAVPGTWSPEGGDAVVVPPTFDGSFSANGARALLRDAPFSVFDTTTGIQQFGEFVVAEGAMSAGTSAAATGAVAEGPVLARGADDSGWSQLSSTPAVRLAISPDGGTIASLEPDGSVRINGGSTTTGLCGDPDPSADIDVADLAVADDAGSLGFSAPVGYCVWQPDGDSGSIAADPNQAFGPIALDAAGATVVVGSEWNGGGIAEVVDLQMFEPKDLVELPRPMTAVRIGEDGTVVAGDDRGNLVVDRSDADGVPIQLPAVEVVVAVDIVTLESGSHLVAAATPRAVYTYLVAAEGAVQPAGGFDLLRGEGSVIDLSFVEGNATRLVVLHSDLFVDELDPQASPDGVAAEVQQLAADRGLLFTDEICQLLVGRDCPAG